MRSIWDLDNWLDSSRVHVVFPEPPWEGTNELVPARTARDLADFARSFENCATTLIDKISMGIAAVYVWQGEGKRVMASIQKQPNNVWRVDEVKGVRNSVLDRASLQRFQQAIKGFEDLDVIDLAQVVKRRGEVDFGRHTKYG